MRLTDRAILPTLVQQVFLVLLIVSSLFNFGLLLKWRQMVLAVSPVLVNLALGEISYFCV